MKILIASHFFYPSIGGVERFTFLMAREFVNLGHEVKVITGIPESDSKTVFPFPVIRKPNCLSVHKLIKWCDVYFQNAISLKFLWQNFFINKPCFIAFQGPIGQKGIIHNLKYFFLKKYNVISVSKGIGKLLGSIPHKVIHNSFQADECQFLIPTKQRKKHLVFLGRLIEEKGLEIAIRAIHKLRQKGLKVTLTAIGPGIKRQSWEELTKRLGLAQQIRFVGHKTGKELVDILNEHQTMIVPSNYPEAFGIVALEGIGCGCTVLASDSYGLPEAIGKCGILFKMGDIDSCANKIKAIVDNFELQEKLLENREQHLKVHTPNAIARQYIDEFKNKI